MIRAEGLTHVPQPGRAMSFLGRVALTRKNTGIGCSRLSAWLLCLDITSHAGQVLLLGQNAPAPPLIRMGLLQRERGALPCADSLGRAESVQQLSVMSHYLFWKAHGALGTAKRPKDSKW